MVSSAYNFFMSCTHLMCSVMDILFCLFLRSWIDVIILSSSLAHFWTFWSSSRFFQSCVAFLNKSVVVLTCRSISCSCSTASFFLFSFTAGGVVGLSCSQRFVISFWYWSIACAIWSIFYVVVISSSCAVFGILSYVLVNFCSNSFMCSLSSWVSRLSYS